MLRKVILLWTVAILVVGCGQNDWKTTDDVQVLSEAKSPDGNHIATVFSCSGGGAAGYVYTNVNLRKAEEELNQREFLLGKHLWNSYANISVEWKDSATLDIVYQWSSNTPAYKKENGQQVREKNGVQINYTLRGE